MESRYLNGGMIGATLDFGANDRYVIGTTQNRLRPTYVSGTTSQINGGTTNVNINLPAGLLADDLVIVALTIAGTADKSYRISGYTQALDNYADDTFDTNLQIGRKFMGVTPDTTVTITGGTGSSADGGAVAIHVWRGIDTTTPLDVTTQAINQINTGIPNPSATTPSTANSVILVAAGSAHNGGTDTYTAAQLANFLTVGQGGNTNDATVGLGSFNWVSGAFDPNAFTWSQTDSTSFSTISATLTLRPKLSDIPIFGNLKNSGVWNLEAAFEYVRSQYTPPGQALFTTTGTQSWTVPPGITEISAVVVGGGGGGGGGETGRNQGVSGGAGGGLAYGTFAVTPGEVLTIVVGTGGAGGTSSNDGNAGNPSTISRGVTVLLSGGGGGAGRERSTATVTGGASTGTEREGGGAGGNSGGNSTDTGSGGGGAGGYTGPGGAGGTTGAGSTGADGGGGGGATNSGQGYGGGGTGLFGPGAFGSTGGPFNGPTGGVGAPGGSSGTRPNGGNYGGGGGACDDDTNGSGGNGAQGVVRIVWGPGRTYPVGSLEDRL
jgi:hypothetical protein